jgi:hypothetical protein
MEMMFQFAIFAIGILALAFFLVICKFNFPSQTDIKKKKKKKQKKL